MLKESEHILKEELGTFTKLYGKESVEVDEVLNHRGFPPPPSSHLIVGLLSVQSTQW